MKRIYIKVLVFFVVFFLILNVISFHKNTNYIKTNMEDNFYVISLNCKWTLKDLSELKLHDLDTTTLSKKNNFKLQQDFLCIYKLIKSIDNLNTLSFSVNRIEVANSYKYAFAVVGVLIQHPEKFVKYYREHSGAIKYFLCKWKEIADSISYKNKDLKYIKSQLKELDCKMKTILEDINAQR